MTAWLGSLALAAGLAAAVPGTPPKGAVRMQAEDVTVLRVLSTPLPVPWPDGTPAAGMDAVAGLVVELERGHDPAPALHDLQAAGARAVALSLRPEGARLLLSVPAHRARDLEGRAARLPGVRSAGPWSLPVTLNDDSIWVGQSYDTVGHGTPIFDHGITGTGELVSVLDTGLDPDECFFVLAPGEWNPAQAPIPPDTGTVDLTKKVVAYYVEPGAEAYGEQGGGHGTSVAGCVLGDNWATLSSPTRAGHDTGDGMAPNARLIVLDGGTGGLLTGVAGDLGPILLQAWRAGARIQNHSWGAPGYNLYGPFAQDLDRFTWRHEDLLQVNAAGNSGGAPGAGTVLDPAVAKNVLAVGATTSGAKLARTLAAFSSRGPAFDGRLKPELVAPGEAQRTASGLDGGPGGDLCQTQDLPGTSFSAPTVAGWAALVRQYYREGYLPGGVPSADDACEPSAALLKATLIASAVSLDGIDPASGQPIDPPPSFNQGFGRPLLEGALYFAGDGRRTMALDLPNDRGLRRLQTAWLDIDVGAGGGEPLEVTLAWTDPPSPVFTAEALLNDIDLTVIDPLGTRYRGNVWEGGASVPGGGADRKNNVEKVRLPAPLPGRYRIQLEAPSVKGAPGFPGSDRQGYALVATYPACSAVPGAVQTPAATDTAGGIRLVWSPVPGALGYLIYRADEPAAPPRAGEFRLLTPGTTVVTDYTDARVECGTRYAYRVRAWNGCAPGPPSPAAQALRSLGSCSRPPGFAGLREARPGGACGEVELRWEAAVSSCPCSTGSVYNVWVSDTPGFDPSTLAPRLSCVAATSVVLSLPPAGGPSYFLVRAEDRVPGGGGRCGGIQENNLEVRVSAPVSPTRLARLVDRFETGRSLWGLRTLRRSNAWVVAGEPFASSPERSLVAHEDVYDTDSAAELLAPVVPGPGTFVSFRHTYDLENRYDGGVVELSADGGASWVDAGPRLVQGPYPDWVMMGERNGYLRRGYTGGTLSAMQESLVWLGDLAGAQVRLRFRLVTDLGIRRERWAVDDVVVFDRDCPATPGELVGAVESTAPACLGDEVRFDAGRTWGGVPPYDYTWEFGDGSPAGSGSPAAHTYGAAGDYTVTLDVRDAVGSTDRVRLPVTIRADVPAPPVGNALFATRSSSVHLVLSWSEPPGSWPASEVLSATRRDLGDLATAAWVSWDGPRAYTRYRGVTDGPPLSLWQVRLRSSCRGAAGP